MSRSPPLTTPEAKLTTPKIIMAMADCGDFDHSSVCIGSMTKVYDRVMPYRTVFWVHPSDVSLLNRSVDIQNRSPSYRYCMYRVFFLRVPHFVSLA